MSPDDHDPGDSKHQRPDGQPAERRRSRGPAAVAAAAAFRGTSTPTPKPPVPRRGPILGRTQDWLDADAGGIIEGFSFTAARGRSEIIASHIDGIRGSSQR
eukprot:2172284-Pyramimonas_sp.AAC.1